jgi:CheY-like chemotaxis protein
MSKRPTVLCVDDQAPNLQIRTLLLQQFGCDTVATDDHASSMQALAENEVDVMVIDYHLADGETGEEIAREVRGLRPDLPLIMLTGDANLPESASGSVDAVLIKGMSNGTALLDLIEKLVPSAELRPRRHMLIASPKKCA